MGQVEAENLKFWLMKVGNDPDLLAEDVHGNKIPLDLKPRPKAFKTFCNSLVQRVCRGMGYDKLDGMMANQIFDHCEANWFMCDEQSAATAASHGDLVIALWKNPDPMKSGHCAVVWPDRRLVFSGQWARYTPRVVAVDKPVPVGCGYAFSKYQLPTFFRLGRENY